MSDAEEETGEDAESDVEPEADASEEETGEAEADGEAAAETEEVEAVETAYGCTVTYSFGQRVIHVPVDAWHATAAALFTDGWEMCVDLTSVDYSAYETARRLPVGVEPERYEVVASFISHSRRERIRARAQVPETNPAIDSIYDIYPGVDYLEREVYDLMGITFDGHPDLSRILMPETWEGHPLRKDFAIGSIPVQFKAGSGTGVEPS